MRTTNRILRALHISHLYPKPDNRRDGHAVHMQVLQTINNGFESTVLCPVPSTPWPLPLIKKKWNDYSIAPVRSEIDRITIYYPRYFQLPSSILVESAGSRMLRGVMPMALSLDKSISFDIIHAHEAYGDGFVALRLSRLLNIPFVVTCRGTDLDNIAVRSSRLHNIIHNVVSAANAVVVPSPRLAHTFQQLFSFKAETICNGFDPKNIFAGESSLTSKYGANKGFILLTVGQLIPSKGMDLIVKATSQLRKKYVNLKCLIIGDGPQKIKLQRLVNDMDLTDSVKFIGRLKHRNVMEYMSICDIFVLPSWQETFGLAYLEAMAHGKPVIGVRGQGIDGVVRSGENGLLVEPKNLESLTQGIDYLLANPEHALLMGRVARELAMENYTWQRNGHLISDVYKRILRKEA